MFLYDFHYRMACIKLYGGEKYSHYKIIFRGRDHFTSMFYNILGAFHFIAFGMFIANTYVHTHNGLRP